MLARTFKTAAELRLNDIQYEGLHKVLDLLEGDELIHYADAKDITAPTKLFHMSCWWETKVHHCGTVGCIGGWASALMQPQGKLNTPSHNIYLNTEYDWKNGSRWIGKTHDLFHPPRDEKTGSWEHITPNMARVTLRHYLETGDVNWKLAA